MGDENVFVCMTRVKGSQRVDVSIPVCMTHRITVKNPNEGCVLQPSVHMGTFVSVLTAWLALQHVRFSDYGQALTEMSMCLLIREQVTDLSTHPVSLCVLWWPQCAYVFSSMIGLEFRTWNAEGGKGRGGVSSGPQGYALGKECHHPRSNR